MSLKYFLRIVFSLLFIASLTLGSTPAALAGRTLPPSHTAAGLLLDTPIESGAVRLQHSLSGLTGYQEVVVRLSGQPAGLSIGSYNQKAQAAAVSAQQDAFIASVRAIDPTAVVLGRTRMVSNAVMVGVDGAKLLDISKMTSVVAINPVGQYQLDLSETVPYIGATPQVQAAAASGAGVKVAILDSGLDYTHVAFGGAGTLAAYLDAYGTSTLDTKNTTLDGLFPTARVVGGYDFVGEAWPNGPLAPDPDPIDCSPSAIGCGGGHGTHVADIIGGALGVAPKVDLVSVKVCSSVSTSCSGVALIEGMDFAVDPNGDGYTGDHVDIINMSLGSPFGDNYNDDLSIAVDNATSVGILTVASAGNSADKPYIVGTPSGARTALSVAQTEVPSSKLAVLEILSPAAIAGSIGAVPQPWAAPLTSILQGPLQYGDGAGGNTLGCDAFPAGSLTGKIVLVNRGTCGFSIKISNIAAGGGLAGVIGLVAPGDPFEGGFGGGTPTVPGYMISQADANKIRSGLAAGVVAKLDPAGAVPLVGTVVGSSSRGPTLGQMYYGNAQMYGQIIKPEIGAPGASVSAVVGTGNGVEAFGGTSGASPMVAGSAALIKDINPFLSPQEIKAWLMNTAETNIQNKPVLFGGGLAPITRIGSGEVRVDRAAAVKAAAWEKVSRIGALSFGFTDVSGVKTMKQIVVVRNYSNKAVTYTIAPSYRFMDDLSNGAVMVSTSASSITVPRNSSKNFTVILTIDGSKLRNWSLNLGSMGGDATTLTTLEYDGYVTLLPTSAGFNTINLPWQVLPRKAANVKGPTFVKLNTPATYTNSGVTASGVDAYALVGVNPFDVATGFAGGQQPVIVIKNVGYATYDGTGICPSNTYLLSFALTTYRRFTTPEAPLEADILLDVNQDGAPEFVVFNYDIGLSLSDGRNVAFVANLRTGSTSAYFYTDHGSNSANMVLTVCGSQLSDPTRPASLGGPLPPPALGQPINVEVDMYDNYFTGALMSYLDGIVIAPGGEHYFATMADIPAGGSSTLTVSSTGSTAPTTETGVLLILDGSRGTGKNGNPEGKEVIAVKVTP